jgi:hypothetical protein
VGLRLAAVFAAALVTALTLANSGSATSVACGATISSSVTLQSDLTCSGDGIVIEVAADQLTPIVVNLNGHAIRGDGTGTGVYIDARATVRNGTVSGFGTGVAADGFRNIELSRLLVTHNAGVGIFDETSANVSVADSVISENLSDGISGIGPTGVIALNVIRTTISKNQANGVRFAFTDGWNISQSAIVGNSGYGVVTSDSSGTISTSTVSRNLKSGVYIEDDYIRGDLAVNEPTGDVFNRVTNVLAEANGDWGIWLDVGPLFPLYDGGGNRANHNGEAAQCLNIVCG